MQKINRTPVYIGIIICLTNLITLMQMVNVDSRYDVVRKIFTYSSEDTDQDDEFVLSHEMVRHSVLNKVETGNANKKKGHGNQLRGSGGDSIDVEELEAIRREV